MNSEKKEYTPAVLAPKRSSTLTMVDENGNSITLVIRQDDYIEAWISAFRKILAFQEFHTETINGYLGE